MPAAFLMLGAVITVTSVAIIELDKGYTVSFIPYRHGTG